MGPGRVVPKQRCLRPAESWPSLTGDSGGVNHFAEGHPEKVQREWRFCVFDKLRQGEAPPTSEVQNG
jgi:hypothetical protein